MTDTVTHLLVKTSHRTFSLVLSVPVGERLSVFAVDDTGPATAAMPLVDVVVHEHEIVVEVNRES